MAWLTTFFLFLLTLTTFVHSYPQSLESLEPRHSQEKETLISRQVAAKGDALHDMASALEVMQTNFWGSDTWPNGIDQVIGSKFNASGASVPFSNTLLSTCFSKMYKTKTKILQWTEAVISTHVSAAVNKMARYAAGKYKSQVQQYFNNVISFYTGENEVTLRTEKYDDMQWVVLEWLEAIKFVNMYTKIDSEFSTDTAEFAHRARVFWDLASVGYNTTLCGGGMLWASTLAPYKNAITNQLFITTSISMYLYSPGDDNPNPSSVPGTSYDASQALSPIAAHDPRYLNAAIAEYNWLSAANMTNSQGLYVDGFHIAGWVNSSNVGTGKCTERDESVYTYNQGVFLSGVRGLWDATGDVSYLDAGHTLVKNVMAATGWTSATSISNSWSGLGSSGILQELCDLGSSCSQDSQTFKGIFFHHLALFCQTIADSTADGIFVSADSHLDTQAHQTACDGYYPWILHNARAAISTQNSNGIYGGWWDPGQTNGPPANSSASGGLPQQPPGSADVMNKGIPDNALWQLPGATPVLSPSKRDTDPNTLGLGRTLETQSGGQAVMGAAAQGASET